MGTTKSRYSIADLGEWFKKQKGKKAVKPVMKSAVESTKGAKEREKKQGSASGSGGKGNQKEVESDQADIKKRSHKKEMGAASG